MGGKNKKDSNQIWADGGGGAQWLIKIIDYVQSGREWGWPSLLKITIHQHLHSEYRPPQVHKQRLNPSRRNSAEYCRLVIVVWFNQTYNCRLDNKEYLQW